MHDNSSLLNPLWVPNESEIRSTNIYQLMQKLKIKSYTDFHKWSVKNREEFWEMMIEKLGIVFKTKYKKIVDLSCGVESPRWLVGASMNIVDSCFKNNPKEKAIIYQKENEEIKTVTYGELDKLTNRVANGLVDFGFKKGDAIAVYMPMTMESVAIYLGIIKAGCVVVSIADSFAAEEVALRLKLSKAKSIFTYDFNIRGGKEIPLYKKVVDAMAPKAIVLFCRPEPFNAQDRLREGSQLRDGDIYWDDFLSTKDSFNSIPRDPNDCANILFSSGTTGEPKVIPWSHTTPIKCVSDGFLHHDIKSGDVVAWPSNLGWMMGPWLIYAALINRGTIAIYEGAPTGKEFGLFIQRAKVTMLGLVPSIVKIWRESSCMEGLDWSSIKCFSSTGECSNPDDYTYLMSLANNRPVIEYCGGTEIGGGYITGTLLQSAIPATFTTPALGLDFVILNENGIPADCGELFIVPPSIGLSTELLNRDHHEVYFSDTPKGPDGEILRRHGDQVERLPNGYFRALGRADDTMNLGGIKVSSAELESVVNKVAGIRESAAIAISPKGGGPSLLVIYVVLDKKAESKSDSPDLLKSAMQQAIKNELNPLFKISDVKIIDSLPRTASNKVMRRVLRDEYKS